MTGSCTVEIDECCSQPCENGGTCTDAHIAYSCACAVGYTGENCDVDVNECDEPGLDCSLTNCTRCHPLRSVEGLPFGAKCFESADYNHKDVTEIVQKTLDNINKALTAGMNVELRNFGVFEVQIRKSRVGRNPNKPETDVMIPRRAVVKFKAGKEMKAGLSKLDLDSI